MLSVFDKRPFQLALLEQSLCVSRLLHAFSSVKPLPGVFVEHCLMMFSRVSTSPLQSVPLSLQWASNKAGCLHRLWKDGLPGKGWKALSVFVPRHQVPTWGALLPDPSRKGCLWSGVSCKQASCPAQPLCHRPCYLPKGRHKERVPRVPIPRQTG